MVGCNKTILHVYPFSGNYGARALNTVTYPGKHSNVICIGACTEDGELYSKSSRGDDVDFLCPGKDVVTTCNSNKGTLISETKICETKKSWSNVGQSLSTWLRFD